MEPMMNRAMSEVAIILIGIRDKRFVDGAAVANVGTQDVLGQELGTAGHT